MPQAKKSKRSLKKGKTSASRFRKPKKSSVQPKASGTRPAPAAVVAKSPEHQGFQALRGMRDILPAAQPYWERARKILNTACQEYGFGRIDTPVVEYASLFTRSVGVGTDIVDKEMYAFTTRGGDTVALRPEFTAGIARAYIEHGMHVLPKPIRLFSTGPVYRYERPQEGRYREHWQANFDVFGEADPILDAQLIQLAYRVVNQLGLKNIEFQVNSIGTPEGRREYEKQLVRYLEAQKHKLCQQCKERILTHPLRIFDCKEDKCMQVASQAPQASDYLDPASKAHFTKLLEYLDELEVPYIVNPRLVRGMEYYTHTVFEIYTVDKGMGKRFALGGGGRYDRLIESLGGERTSAIGFALGLDRIVLEMERIQVKPYLAPRPRIFLAQLGELAKKKSLRLFAELEKNGILVAESFGRGSLKSQMRAANRAGAEVTLILGQKEALDGTIIIKDMVSGTQETAVQSRLIAAVKKLLKTNTQLHMDKLVPEVSEEDEEED